MRQLFACAVTVACALSAGAFAQEKLAFKLEEGRKLVYLTETKTEQVLTIAGMDLETKNTAFQKSSHTLGQRAADGTIRQTDKVESLQIDMQLPGGLSFNFDSGNPNKAPDNPLLEPVAKLFRVLCQSSSTLIYDRNDAIKDAELPADIAAQVDPMFQGDFSAEKVKKQAQQQRLFLPTEPVKPGDKWEFNTDTGIGGGQTFSFRTECEYTGIVEKDGRKLHRIVEKPLTVSYAMDPASQSPLKVLNSDLKIAEAEGEYLFDAERGITHSHTSKVHIVGPMTFSVNGQELPGKVDLTINAKVAMEPQ